MKINSDPIYGFNYNQEDNNDFCFALLTDKYRVYFTPTVCKDYLQDIFWSERTDNEAELYGMEVHKGMIDDTKKRFLLGIFGGGENMRERVPYMQQFINAFDDAQGIKRTKVMETDEDGEIIVEFDRAWTNSGPLLSTLTTLIRLSGGYKGEDVIEYLKKLDKKRGTYNIEPAYMFPDVMRLGKSLKKLAAVLAGKKVILPWEEIESIDMAHNLGIVEWKEFPTVEV